MAYREAVDRMVKAAETYLDTPNERTGERPRSYSESLIHCAPFDAVLSKDEWPVHIQRIMLVSAFSEVLDKRGLAVTFVQTMNPLNYCFELKSVVEARRLALATTPARKSESPIEGCCRLIWTVIISVIVLLTLSPILCSIVIKISQ